MNTCPHCNEILPVKLRWVSLFAGQTSHICPACKQSFRLAYQSKIRISFINVLLILGFLVSWNMPNPARNLGVFAAVAVIAIFILARLSHYEKTSNPYDSSEK